MNLMEIQYPGWYFYAIFGTWVYALCAVFLMPRASDARLVIALPLLADTAVGCYAGFDLLRAAASVGDVIGPLTRASTVALAITPAFHGALRARSSLSSPSSDFVRVCHSGRHVPALLP